MKANGWDLCCTQLFQTMLDELEEEVTRLQQAHPENYQSHSQYKFLAAIYKILIQEVPVNPNSAKYVIRKQTLEKRKKARKAVGNWYRAKSGRNRIFFQFSEQVKMIIYAWMNDSGSIRKSGDKKDVYKVFKRLLDRNIIPQQFAALQKQSDPLKSTDLSKSFLPDQDTQNS